jgi:hypothetical protein
MTSDRVHGVERESRAADVASRKARLSLRVWGFPRIIDRAQFAPDIFSSDVYLVNWPMIGSMEGDRHSGSEVP